MSRITLQRLIVQGISYRRTIEFNEHLTIISGEKTSGKSLILSLIDYCFGKSSKIDLKVQPELDAKCDQVFLEIKINEEVLTLNRMLKQKQSKISIYFCSFENLDEYTPKTVDIQEVMKIIMHKLNINEYKLIRHQKHSNKKEIDVVSFRDIFRFVYVHQHELGTGDFLGKKNVFKANKNVHAFKMMFNLVDVDKDTLNEQLVKVQNDMNEKKRELFGLNSYIKDLDASNRIELQAQSDKLIQDIKTQNQLKKDVLEKSRAKTNDNSENKMYIKLKNDSNEISNKIFECQNQKRHLQLSVHSKEILIQEYLMELAEIEETIELNYTLIIPDQSVECPLCNTRVQNNLSDKIHNSTDAERTLHKIRKQISSKINLVKELIENERGQIEELDKEIAVLLKKRSLLNEGLSEYSKKTDVPYLSQIDSVNIIINRLTKNHEVLKEGLRIHHKIDEKNKLIEDLKAAETRLIKDLEALQVSDNKKDNILSFLDEEYRLFMERLKYDTTDETFIHRQQFIPYYNGASVYSHESGGLLECMQLSYLGAILKSKKKGYGTGHPGVLILDSLSKYVGTLKKGDTEEKINDPEVYEEFFKILIELSVDNQIILVENTPPEQYDEFYTKYTFYKGEKGLINEEKNEMKDYSGYFY